MNSGSMSWATVAVGVIRTSLATRPARSASKPAKPAVRSVAWKTPRSRLRIAMLPSGSSCTWSGSPSTAASTNRPFGVKVTMSGPEPTAKLRSRRPLRSRSSSLPGSVTGSIASTATAMMPCPTATLVGVRLLSPVSWAISTRRSMTGC